MTRLNVICVFFRYIYSQLTADLTDEVDDDDAYMIVAWTNTQNIHRRVVAEDKRRWASEQQQAPGVTGNSTGAEADLTQQQKLLKGKFSLKKVELKKNECVN